MAVSDLWALWLVFDFWALWLLVFLLCCASVGSRRRDRGKVD